MSRVGKKTITLPSGVEFQEADGLVTIKGPLGTLTRQFPRTIKVAQIEAGVSVSPLRESGELKAMWGTAGAHLRNMVEGVTKGFTKQLILEGIGYKATLAGDSLNLDLGFSHQIKMKIPAGVKVMVEKANITVSGFDKEVVGQFAAVLRALKPVEPYKGKGMRYADELVRRKQGKKTAA